MLIRLAVRSAFVNAKMPELYKKRIIKFLRHADYTPLKLQKLAKQLGITPRDYHQFKLAFDQLRQAGHVVIGAGNLISLPSIGARVIGTFRATPKGFGFVTPLDPISQGDLFIPPKATANAMTGDTVAATVVKKAKTQGQLSYTGKIVQILHRAQNRFVGTLIRQSRRWVVQPDGKGFLEPIAVDDVAATNAKEKDKVVVEILTYPTEKYLAGGVIVEVLGRAGQYQTEINSIIRQYHLRDHFDEDCINQARNAAAGFNPEKTGTRDDITEKTVVTIDPPDAKDFDDAISLEKNSDGNWVLGVHIADVSFFVTPDSPLDTEAKMRGNSVYLPGKTIPMLPEILSNGICSLQPDRLRFAKSAYLTYDKQGNVISRSFANSLIRSTRRLTYLEADKILKGRTKAVPPQIVQLLKNMETLSRLIEKRRTKNGMLHLDLPEIELVMDEAGRVVDAHPADDCYPHTIIEMFMVEANEAVASLLDRLNIPIMRRIHPEPDALSMKNLAQLVRAFGYTLPRTPDRADIQRLLQTVKNADAAFAVNLAVLRSLEKAQYSPLHIGHFALASTHYCHFTSPIRRYADLLIHRLLDCYLQKSLDSPPENYILSESELKEIGSRITFAEQQAEDAERELKTVLILNMLSSHIGDELECVVTGLAAFGMFVQSRTFGIEGLIRIDDLGPDQWKFNKKAQCIVSLRSGYTFRLGQSIKTRIVSVNIPARQLNLTPAQPLDAETAGSHKPRTKKKPKKQRTKNPTKKRK